MIIAMFQAYKLGYPDGESAVRVLIRANSQWSSRCIRHERLCTPKGTCQEGKTLARSRSDSGDGSNTTLVWPPNLSPFRAP
eukprot:6106863-Pyramimonas_sp.AAC.1